MPILEIAINFTTILKGDSEDLAVIEEAFRWFIAGILWRIGESLGNLGKRLEEKSKGILTRSWGMLSMSLRSRTSWEVVMVRVLWENAGECCY
jgi:hypothetical protein